MAQRARIVAAVEMPVPRVGEADRAPQRVQQPQRLEARHVEDGAPSHLQAPRDLGQQRTVVGHVLEHVRHHDQIEGRIGVRQPRVANLRRRLAERAANRAHGVRGEVRALPVAALLAKEPGDDAVVGAQVECALAARIARRARELPPLRLLEHRDAKAGELELAIGEIGGGRLAHAVNSARGKGTDSARTGSNENPVWAPGPNGRSHARGGIRTRDLRLRRPTLYPAELLARRRCRSRIAPCRALQYAILRPPVEGRPRKRS